MSAIGMFNDQQVLAGQKLGISTAKACALITMAVGLGAMNIYHMGNSITSKLLTPDSSLFLFALLYFIASCIAFIEVPLTEEIVTLKAKNDAKRPDQKKEPVLAYKLMLTIVACMAVAGGVYSMTTDAEKVDALRTGHATHNSSFEDLKQGLISDRNAARKQALSFSSASQRQIETSRANSDYYKALAKLKIEQAGHQGTRPTQAVETGSVWHWLWTIGFSLLCSLGVIAITSYLTKYHKPLTEIPRVFFKVKENQEWMMNDDDVRVIPAQVDLSGGSSTTAARKAIKTPSPVAKNQGAEVDQNHPTQKRPALDETRVNGENSVSGRTLNPDTKAGVFTPEQYVDLRRAIMAGDLPPTVRAIKAYLKSEKIGESDKTRSGITDKILTRMKTDGVLILNPEQGKTNKVVAKYVLNPDYKVGQSATAEERHPEDDYWRGIVSRLDRGEHVPDLGGKNGQKPQGLIDYEERELKRMLASSSTDKVNGGVITRQGHIMSFTPDNFGKPDRMISSNCPSCDHQSSVSESNLRKWGGAVSCPECKTDYRLKKKAKITPVAGAGVSIGEDGLTPTIGLGAIGGKV